MSTAQLARVRLLGGALLLERGRSQARSQDIDEAIAWFDMADGLLPEGARDQAGVRGNLGLALLERHQLLDGGRRDDLDRAIALLGDAAAHLEGRSRADALHSLGLAYHERADVDGSADDLRSAIACLRQAIDEADDAVRAGYRNSLASALRALALAVNDRSLLVESVGEWEAALAEPEGSGADQIGVALNLSNALVDLGESSGDVGRVDQAIDLLEQVLQLVEPSSRKWAKAANNLASSLTVRFHLTGDADALAAALGRLEAAASQLPPDGPHRDVVTANLAGLLHETYENTGRLELLERSITLGEQLVAAESRPRPAQSRRHNLAVSLLARYRRLADLADLDQAIACFRAAIDLAPATTDAQAARNSLGNALHLRYDAAGDLTDLREAITAYEASLAGAAEESPMDQALVRSGLGVALMTLATATGEPAHLDRAEQEQRRAVRDVPTRAPLRARVMTALADSLALRATRSASDADEQEAIRLYARACRVAVRDLPEQAVGTAVSWGDWAAQRASWEEAARAYGLGMRAVRALVDRQELRLHKETWLRAVQGLPQGASHAHTRLGRLDRAVSVIESGRAVLLGEALELRARATGARPRRSRPLPSGWVVVHLVPSESEGHALIERAGRGPGGRWSGREAICLPELSVGALAARAEALAVSYRQRDVRRAAWLAALDDLCRWAWDAAGGALVDALTSGHDLAGPGVPVTLIPTGPASIVPFHAAWTPEPGAPGGRRYLHDSLAVAYAPSARWLRSAPPPPRDAARRPVLVVSEPRPTSHPVLPTSPAEVKAASWGASQATVLRGRRATVERVLTELPGAGVFHATCHGVASLAAPLDSALVLAGDRSLTAGQVLDVGAASVSLAVLSACESGVIGEPTPDEMIGLPVALLQAGVRTVVATQWAVPDRSAASVVAAFYENRRGGDPPAEALRRAQRSVRAMRNSELPGDVRAASPAAVPSSGPARALWETARPFAHPVWWAGFMVVGVGHG